MNHPSSLWLGRTLIRHARRYLAGIKVFTLQQETQDGFPVKTVGMTVYGMKSRKFFHKACLVLIMSERSNTRFLHKEQSGLRNSISLNLFNKPLTAESQEF
ncbi:MAG: hypothetical protein ACE1ZW_03615, partial [Nitrospirales bacterium]